MSLLIYAVFKGVNSMAEIDVIYRTSRLDSASEHTAHMVQLVVFVFQVQLETFPKFPTPMFGLHWVQTFALQGSFRPGTAAGHSSLTLALIVGSFGSGWAFSFSPEAY